MCGLLMFILIVRRRFLRYELQGVSGRSTLMNPPRADSPRLDLLEFAIGSDVSIEVKRAKNK